VKEVWRTNWLKALELERRPLEMTLDDDLRYIRVFGPLRSILAMIEEGDQGAPLQTRVTKLRNDRGIMKTLTDIWRQTDIRDRPQEVNSPIFTMCKRKTELEPRS
jgi:hypothetical protein